MIGSTQRPGGRAVRGWLLSLCLAVQAASGCGHDGSVDVAFLPTPRPIEPAITGTVFAPNGEFAAAGTWWRWPQRLGLVSSARARTCLEDLQPAGGILNVALQLVDLIDAKDGEIDNPRLINQDRTDDDGLYEIVDPAAEHIDACRLMVVVGREEILTRAFVFGHTTNIDAVSEAVVRVVLERLTQAPPVQLCDFSNAGLANILAAARNAACSASGSTVAEFNDSAFERVRVNRKVQEAIDAATGVPVSP